MKNQQAWIISGPTTAGFLNYLKSNNFYKIC